MGSTLSWRKHAPVCLMVVALALPAFAAEEAATESPNKPILSQAAYRGLRPGRFMTKWLILGPIPVSADEATGKAETDQKRAFETDPLPVRRFRAKVRIGNQQYQWTPLTSESDVVDLVGALGHHASVLQALLPVVSSISAESK